MLDHFWRWQGRQRAAGLDWLFVAFLVVTGATGTWWRMRERDLRKAFSETERCLGQLDAPCAGAAVETLRSLGADDARTRIAEAGVAVLLHQYAEARAALAAVRQETRLDARARGELL